MKKHHLIFIGLVVILIVLYSSDAFAGLFDAIGIKRKPKPTIQGG